MNDLSKELREAEELYNSTKDRDLKELAAEEIANIKKQMVGSDASQNRNVILEIRAGTGGDEAELFAMELLRMYQRFAERMGWKFVILDSDRSSLGGLKNLTAE